MTLQRCSSEKAQHQGRSDDTVLKRTVNVTSSTTSGQCVKRCHLVTDTLARLLPIAVPANLPGNGYRERTAGKLPHFIPNEE